MAFGWRLEAGHGRQKSDEQNEQGDGEAQNGHLMGGCEVRDV